MREIQYGVTQQDHEFFMFAVESSGKRLIACLHDNAVSDPLPELRLGCPELTTVTTDHKRRLALLLFLFVFVFLRGHALL